VDSESCTTAEITGPSGQRYTLHVEAWWEDEPNNAVHLSVIANRGSGLRLTGHGQWRLLEPPEQIGPQR